MPRVERLTSVRLVLTGLRVILIVDESCGNLFRDIIIESTGLIITSRFVLPIPAALEARKKPAMTVILS